MEGMRVRVKSTEVRPDCVFASIVAVSHERILGIPRAVLKVRLCLEAVAGESVKGRLARAREEALRYLDID
jgi:hypothetical protein